MELKQSAYILSQNFSVQQSHDRFRACLAELERGCRNFVTFEKLTTDLGQRASAFYKPSKLDIEELVKRACERILPYSRVAGIEILVVKNGGRGAAIPKIVGNPEALLECLLNVLHNAIKYSIGRDPVEVKISKRQPSGVDIRAETARAITIEGSGIGLYVSRRLVEHNDGSVRVESCVPAKQTEDQPQRWKTTFIISLKC
jgi:signal transduction histidine kinase